MSYLGSSKNPERLGNIPGEDLAGYISAFTFGTGETLLVGKSDTLELTISRGVKTADGAGNDLQIRGGQAKGTNQVGGNVKILTGIPTGNAAAGDFTVLGALSKGSSGTSINSSNSTMFSVSGDTGDAVFANDITIGGGFVLDGNTITGVDDSAEFTDDDAHIMTSAAINDRFAQINADTTGQAGTVATIAGLAPNTATTAAAQPNITSLGTLTAGLSIGGASYTGDGVSVTGSPSDNTYDVFIGKRKFPRITLIDDAASGDTEFQIWNLGDELRIGTNASSHGNAALVIHAGNAALVEVQDDLLVNDDLTVSGQIELGHASDTTIARSAAGTVTIEGETVATTKTEVITSGNVGALPLVTMMARRTLTTAEMNSLHSTPIQIAPAPGANKVALPVGGMVRVDRASTNNNNGSINFHYEGLEPSTFGTDSIIHLRRFHSSKTTDGVYNLGGSMPNSSLYANSLTEDVNKAIEVSIDAASTTNCFTSVDIFLTYQIIEIA